MNEEDYKRETEDLLLRLIAAGFQILSVDNGEEKTLWSPDLVNERGLHEEFVSETMACDESVVCVSDRNGKKSALYLVYGNGAGELVADYTATAELEAVVDGFYEAHSV